VFGRNRSFPAFGEPLLAVADATVVRVADGKRDHLSRNSPLALLYMLTIDGPVRDMGGAGWVLGNHVTLDLGNGTYATYAHTCSTARPLAQQRARRHQPMNPQRLRQHPDQRGQDRTITTTTAADPPDGAGSRPHDAAPGSPVPSQHRYETTATASRPPGKRSDTSSAAPRPTRTPDTSYLGDHLLSPQVTTLGPGNDTVQAPLSREVTQYSAPMSSHISYGVGVSTVTRSPAAPADRP
jgi:hypothetical protein